MKNFTMVFLAVALAFPMVASAKSSSRKHRPARQVRTWNECFNIAVARGMDHEFLGHTTDNGYEVFQQFMRDCQAGRL